MAHRNLYNSRIYTLPYEVLTEVNEFLPGADSLALRATSRKFRVALSTALAQGPRSTRGKRMLIGWEQRRFLRRMYRDQACAMESNGTLLPHQPRACKACVSVHPPSHFSAAQLAIADPEERSCTGSLGKLRACAHVAFRFHELKERFEARPTEGQIVDCASCFPDPGDSGIALRPRSSRCGAHDVCSIISWSRIMVHKSPVRELHDASAVTVETLLAALAELKDEYIGDVALRVDPGRLQLDASLQSERLPFILLAVLVGVAIHVGGLEMYGRNE